MSGRSVLPALRVRVSIAWFLYLCRIKRFHRSMLVIAGTELERVGTSRITGKQAARLVKFVGFECVLCFFKSDICARNCYYIQLIHIARSFSNLNVRRTGTTFLKRFIVSKKLWITPCVVRFGCYTCCWNNKKEMVLDKKKNKVLINFS